MKLSLPLILAKMRADAADYRADECGVVALDIEEYADELEAALAQQAQPLAASEPPVALKALERCSRRMDRCISLVVVGGATKICGWVRARHNDAPPPHAFVGANTERAALRSQSQAPLTPDEHEAVKALLQTALDDIEEETPTMMRHVESLRALLSRSISPQPQAPTRELEDVIADALEQSSEMRLDTAVKYIAKAVLALYADAAPTCEHNETKAHSIFGILDTYRHHRIGWCPGPVAAQGKNGTGPNGLSTSAAPQEQPMLDAEKVARVAVLPDKIRKLKDGKHLQDYVAMLIEEAIDADIQNGFTRAERRGTSA